MVQKLEILQARAHEAFVLRANALESRLEKLESDAERSGQRIQDLASSMEMKRLRVAELEKALGELRI